MIMNIILKMWSLLAFKLTNWDSYELYSYLKVTSNKKRLNKAVTGIKKRKSQSEAAVQSNINFNFTVSAFKQVVREIQGYKHTNSKHVEETNMEPYEGVMTCVSCDRVGPH